MESQHDKETKCGACTGHCHWSYVANYYNLNNGYRFELKTLKLGLQMSLRKVLEGNRKRKTAQAMVDNIKRNSNVTREDVKKKMKTVQSLLR